MDGPDFLTIDAFGRPPGGRIRWRRDLARTIDAGIDGLRGATVNHANNGTHSLAPNVVPGGCALVAAWDCAEPAEAAFAGPLRRAIDGAGRFSMDSEIVRVRIDSESESDHWHGWQPNAGGAKPLEDDEPMVAIVHGILRRGRLVEFLRNNMHAASRAAHHPGHRGSIDHLRPAALRAHLDQPVEDLRPRAGLRLQEGRTRQRDDPCAEGEDPSGRGLPAGPAARLHRHVRDGPGAVPPAAGGPARMALSGVPREGLLRRAGAMLGGERLRATREPPRGRLLGRRRR